MDHAQAHLGEHTLHLVPHPQHVVLLLQGSGLVAGGVHVGAVGSVGLGGVGMDDEDLGALRRQGDVHRRLGGRGQIHALPGAVIEVQPSGHVVALGAGGDQGAGDNVRRRGGDLRLLPQVVVVLGGLPRRQLEVLLGRLAQIVGHRVLAARHQPGLAHRQPVPAVQRPQQPGAAGASQLRRQGGGHKGPVLPQTFQGSRRPAAQDQQPHRQGGQK